MIGKAVSLEGKKYNIVILAGGAGSRMGVASDFIPKALAKLGDKRAIDYIIERYSLVAHKYIIGTGFHSDLLTSYVSDKIKEKDLVFSVEKPEEIKNNSISTALALDNADSRYGTIVAFCDLIMVDNFIIEDDTVYIVSELTEGNLGTFRHRVESKPNSQISIIVNEDPIQKLKGLLGTFVFGNTPLLKSIVYQNYNNLIDFTDDAVVRYNELVGLKARDCKAVYEFGNEEDLKIVRRLWENV